jgi:hypothetical protein
MTIDVWMQHPTKRFLAPETELFLHANAERVFGL